MTRYLSLPFIGASRLPRAYSTTTSIAPPPAPPSSGFARLANRRLLAVHGPDAAHFLHGLTTSNVLAGQTVGFYSAFLNAQGRVLNDVFIYPAAHARTYRDALPEKLKRAGNADQGYFVEVDGKEVERLYRHVRKYKLRAKVDLRVVEDGEWAVWSAWDEAEPWTPHPPAQSHPTSTAREGSTFVSDSTDTVTSSSVSTPDGPSGSGATSDIVGCVDVRAPGMGRRFILPGSSSSTAQPPFMSASAQTDLSAYTLRRILRGVPEGQTEIPSEAALPQEYNIDFMGGIDFRKGCYLGQELTIRTHHTGVVRKRVLPVMLYRGNDKIPERLEYEAGLDLVGHARLEAAIGAERGANIMPTGRSGRSAGRWITGMGNVGLGLCRIEMMTDMILTAEAPSSKWSPEHEFKVVLPQMNGSGTGGGDKDGSEVQEPISKGRGDVQEEIRIKAFVPDWHRSKTKIRKSPVRV